MAGTRSNDCLRYSNAKVQKSRPQTVWKESRHFLYGRLGQKHSISNVQLLGSTCNTFIFSCREGVWRNRTSERRQCSNCFDYFWWRVLLDGHQQKHLQLHHQGDWLHTRFQSWNKLNVHQLLLCGPPRPFFASYVYLDSMFYSERLQEPVRYFNHVLTRSIFVGLPRARVRRKAIVYRQLRLVSRLEFEKQEITWTCSH